MTRRARLAILLLLASILQACGKRECVADGSTDIDVRVTVTDVLNHPVSGVDVYFGDLTTGYCDAVKLLGTTDGGGRLEVRFPYTWCRQRWHRTWRSDTGDLEVECAMLIATKSGYSPAVTRVGRFRLDALVSPVIRQQLILKTSGD